MLFKVIATGKGVLPKGKIVGTAGGKDKKEAYKLLAKKYGFKNPENMWELEEDTNG